ncbi:hypothetical protein QQ020_23125 [Fulvivirgaceae bacterium BMA12]|uniref:Alpha-L-fucosidase n=1 Tax=Agaribacillus aureus TaxID=3051825 RepID=A0ABT8LB45_9BACT|nr:hypothetical protein [Fulvivirgaceae bacterium BMA12]
MKQIKIHISVIAILLLTVTSRAQQVGGGEANPNLFTHQKALKAFQSNRFGLFIHWEPLTPGGEKTRT